MSEFLRALAFCLISLNWLLIIAFGYPASFLLPGEHWPYIKTAFKAALAVNAAAVILFAAYWAAFGKPTFLK